MKVPELVKYRERELSLFSSYVGPDPEINSPSVMVEGPSSSGKTYTVRAYTEYLKKTYNVDYLLVECDFCMTRRRVLQKILRYIYETFEVPKSLMDRTANHCENLSNFVYSMKRAISSGEASKRSGSILIILDRIDRMIPGEQPEEVCAALSRLHEQSPLFSRFSFIFVVNRADYMEIPTMSIPTVKFQPYTSEEVKRILGELDVDEKWLMDVKEEIGSSKITLEELERFVRDYVGYMIDTYGAYFGSNIEMIIPVLRKIWPLFLEPVKKRGMIKPRVNDVLSTFMKNKKLLQTELGLVNRLEETDRNIIEEEREEERMKKEDEQEKEKNTVIYDNRGQYDLSNKTKYLIIASYLASFTEPKYDMVNYSKNREIRSNRRVRYKKRKINGKNQDLATRLMSPQPFTLERMLAILHAICDEFDQREEISNDVGLMNEIATLTSLKTLVKLSGNDTIGGGSKWRSNVEWTVVKKFAGDVGFRIENYLSY